MYPHGLKSLSPDTTVEKTLARLGSKFEMQPLPAEGSMYVKPAAVMYELDGELYTLRCGGCTVLETTSRKQGGSRGVGSRGRGTNAAHMQMRIPAPTSTHAAPTATGQRCSSLDLHAPPSSCLTLAATHKHIGKQRRWNVIEAHSSVAGVLYPVF
jgi:hypothetical protein